MIESQKSARKSAKNPYSYHSIVPGILFIMVFLVWLKGMMLLKPALLLPGLYMLYMLSLPPGYRGLLYTGLKGGGARVVLVIGGIGGPEVRKVLAGCKVKMALWRNLLPKLG